MQSLLQRNQLYIVAAGILAMLGLRAVFGWSWLRFGECPVYALTGFSCPGCGVTRMFLALVQGQVYQAFRYNSGVFVLVCLSPFVVIANSRLAHQIHHAKISAKAAQQIKDVAGYALLGIVILYGVARNLPKFSWLLPTIV